MTDGGEGTLGYKHTEKTKETLSNTRKGENHHNYGKKLSEETKERIGNSNRGKKYSEEYKLFISKSRKGSIPWNKKVSMTDKQKENLGTHQKTRATHSKSKLILDLQTGIFYDCIKDAAEAYGYVYRTLCQRLDGTVRNKTNLVYV